MSATADARRTPREAVTDGRRDMVPALRPERRGRLFVKYAAALVGLVSLVLLLNGVVNVWFAYTEAKDTAVRLQREKAEAAARRNAGPGVAALVWGG